MTESKSLFVLEFITDGRLFEVWGAAVVVAWLREFCEVSIDLLREWNSLAVRGTYAWYSAENCALTYSLAKESAVCYCYLPGDLGLTNSSLVEMSCVWSYEFTLVSNILMGAC